MIRTPLLATPIMAIAKNTVKRHDARDAISVWHCAACVTMYLHDCESSITHTHDSSAMQCRVVIGVASNPVSRLSLHIFSLLQINGRLQL